MSSKHNGGTVTDHRGFTETVSQVLAHAHGVRTNTSAITGLTYPNSNINGQKDVGTTIYEIFGVDMSAKAFVNSFNLKTPTYVGYPKS